MKLRIVVEPHDGIFFTWHWELQELTKKYGWQPIRRDYTPVQGYARTEERALERGRNAAKQLCEDERAIADRLAKRERATTIEEYECPPPGSFLTNDDARNMASDGR